MNQTSRRKSKILSYCIITVMIISMIPTMVFASPLSDTDNHWAKDQINDWVDKGLVKGYEDGTFKPENKITRAEFMSLVNGAFGYSEKAVIDFSDVPTNAWYSDNVAIAKAAGYIRGYSDGTVKPNNLISRQETAAIIMKITKIAPNLTAAEKFNDASSIPEWSKGAVGAVVNAQIMEGYLDGAFRASNFITRAEAVVALNKALNSKQINVAYDKAGVYGPETGEETIEGNVTVSADDVILQNLKIKGTLTLTKNIGEGEVTLKNVTVIGVTEILGGGKNSIIVIDSQLGHVKVYKENGKIRIVVSGSTRISEITVNSGVTLEENNLTGEGFGKIIIDSDESDTIVLIGFFDTVEVQSDGVTIDIPNGSKVDTLTLNKKATIIGKGTIKTMEVNASGVVSWISPSAVNLANKTEPPTIITPTIITPTSFEGDGGSISPTKSNNANLSDLTVNGTTVIGFTQEILTHNVELAAGTTDVPTVIGTVNDIGKAIAVVNNAASLPGATTVVVTAEDGTTTKTYTINFTVAVPEAPGAPTAPTAPTNPITNDFYNNFGCTYVTGYENATDYEYTKDGGSIWTTCDSNPQGGFDGDIAASDVMVRVKADAGTGRPAGQELQAVTGFTTNADVELTNLVLSGTPSNFTFASDTYTYYAVTVPNDQDTINVTATLEGANITISYETGEQSLSSGVASPDINLVAEDKKTISIVVHKLGYIDKTYIIKITRVKSDLTGTIARISVSADGIQGNGGSASSDISSDGRYVTFASVASNLVLGDTNNISDIFVYDRLTEDTSRVSVASDGTQGNGAVFEPQISGNDKYIAFVSDSNNLVPNDTNGDGDIFVHNRLTGTTVRVNVASDGTQANNTSYLGDISQDGRYVVFHSYANNLVTNDTNDTADIFIHDLQTGETTRVSVAADGTQGNSSSGSPTISANNRYVVFESNANNLVSNDTNAKKDIFRYDIQEHEIILVSVASDGTQGNNISYRSSISADGRYVVFDSYASNLVEGDTNGAADIFIHDCQTGNTTRISVASDGTQGNSDSEFNSISDDVRYVVFGSYSSNLVTNDTNNKADIFIRDLQTGKTVLLSKASDGTKSIDYSGLPCISADGKYVVFESDAFNLVSSDTNNARDIFITAVPEAAVNTDATLSDLTVNGTTVTGFASETLTYNVELPTGTTDVPTVIGIVNDTGIATMVVNNAASLPGTTTVMVTAEDGTTTKSYTINFTVAALEKPVAPTNPVTNDFYNSFGWTNVVGFDNETEYEYTKDGGTTWTTCSSNAQDGFDGDIAASDVMVRVKADVGTGRPAGTALTALTGFTTNADVQLTGLVLSGIPSNFTFVPGTYTYTGVTVPNDQANIMVTSTLADASLTIAYQIGGQSISSGVASPEIALTAGEVRTISIAVHKIGYLDKTYTIEVTREYTAAPAAPTLPSTNDFYNSFGWTNVVGIDNETEYEYTKDGGTTWTTCSSNAQDGFDGDIAASDVMVRVKADVGTGRPAGTALTALTGFTTNADVQLTGLVLSGIPSNFTFVPGTYTYTGVTVPNDQANIMVTSTLADASLTIAYQIGGQSISSGVASPEIALTAGEVRTISIAVHKIGYLDKTYTIEVTREAAPAAPTLPSTNDFYNSFGWTNVVGIDNETEYEYTKDGGTTWTTCSSNAQDGFDGDIAASDVMVRVKADAGTGRPAGTALTALTGFTTNADVQLTGLVLSGIPSNFTFVPGTYTYTGVTVPNDQANIMVTSTLADASLTIAYQIGGQSISSGVASPEIALTAGEVRTISIAVHKIGYLDKTYTIEVTREAAPAASTETDITAFFFTEQVGTTTINTINHSVTIKVLNGTDLTSLAPGITVSEGATISPVSGAEQNFTNPVSYTVTAEDGTTTQVWTVTVTEANPPLAAETAVYDLYADTTLDIAMTLNGDTLVKIEGGGGIGILLETDHYTDSGNIVTLTQSFMQNFNSGDVFTLTFTFISGTTDETIITIIDSTPQAADLTGLTIARGSDGSGGAVTFNSMFSGSTYSYTASILDGTTIVKVTPTAAVGTTAVVGNEGVISGLVQGANTITVVISEPDKADKFYTITLTVSMIPPVAGVPNSGSKVLNSTAVTLGISFGATAYYTTDGSEPPSGTTLEYNSTVGITISGSTGDTVTVKAVQVKNGIQSPITTLTYTIAQIDYAKVRTTDPTQLIAYGIGSFTNGTGDPSAFTVSGSHGVSSVTVSGNMIYINLDTPIASGETITLTYTKTGTGNIKLSDGTEIDNFEDLSVLNQL